MARFADKFGSSIGRNSARINAARGFIAAKVRNAAEEEIQSVLKEVEGRIRARISQNIECTIGEMTCEYDGFADKTRVTVKVHVVDRSPGPEVVLGGVDLGTGELL